MIEIICYIWLSLLFLAAVYYLIKSYQPRTLKNIENPLYFDPSLIGYLVDKKITSKGILASIDSMILNDIIILQDGILKKSKGISNDIEKLIIDFLFDDKDEVTIYEITKKLKSYKNKSDLQIRSIYTRIKVESKLNDFFNETIDWRILLFFYSCIGLILSIIVYIFYSKIWYMAVAIMLISLCITYISIKYKARTQKGKREYNKWMIYKNTTDKIPYLIIFNKKIDDENIREFNRVFCKKIGPILDKYINKIRKTNLNEKKEYSK